MFRSFFVEVSLLPVGRTAFSFIGVGLIQAVSAISLDICPTRPFLLSCRLMDTLELDVGINTNDDVIIVCEDTRHVAITVAPNPQQLDDILHQERSPVVMISILREFAADVLLLQIIMVMAWFMVVVCF